MENEELELTDVILSKASEISIAKYGEDIFKLNSSREVGILAQVLASILVAVREDIRSGAIVLPSGNDEMLAFSIPYKFRTLPGVVMR